MIKPATFFDIIPLMIREEFPQRIKDLAAKRAGFICSMPECEQITIGPGDSHDQSKSIGRANHIYSASGERGPRGSGGLSSDELKSIENCFWTCANCSDIIDKNEGKDFSPETLLAYKHLHEAKIKSHLEGSKIPFNWFYSMTISDSPIFIRGSTFKLGQLTLLNGSNSSGKTALCDWIVGSIDPELTRRWLPPNRISTMIKYDVIYYDPNEQCLSITISKSGRYRVRLNGRNMPFLASNVKILWPKGHLSRIEPDTDDINRLSQRLDTPIEITVNLIEHLNNIGSDFIDNIRIVKSDEGYKLYFKFTHNKYEVPMSGISGSELNHTLIEFAVLQASEWSQHCPTLLILDGVLNNFDKEHFASMTRYFRESDNVIQIIASSPIFHVEFSTDEWKGWSMVNLIGKKRNVRINQSSKYNHGSMETQNRSEETSPKD